MRDPSIHITQSRLVKIIDSLFKKSIKSEELARLIVKEARKYTLNNRKIDITNKKVEKKVTRVISSTNSDTELFSLLLLHYRRKLKHRGITQIKQNSRDWLTVKEIVTLANEFCETFSLEKREGYLEFIKIGISKMNKFMIVKFTPMGSSIIETYQAMLELKEDKYPEKTQRCHDYYQKTIIAKTGVAMDYKDNPDKYVYFYRVRLLAERLKVDPLVFIKAQFYALEWRNGYPDPIQLTNDKAINHLNKYLYEKGDTKPQKTTKIDFSKIKKMGESQDD